MDVGSHCGFSLITQGDAREIVFIDTDKQKAAAQAGDICDSACFMPHPVIVRTGNYDDCRDAAIVVIAAGIPRKPGQTRLDTMGDSVKVMKEIIVPLKNSGFEGILICISNPADVIANYMRNHTGWSKNRVFGTGTSLDTARLMKEKPELYGKLDFKNILQRTRTIGMDIINGKNSTEFGIGSVLADMVKAIFHNEHRIMPVSALLEG